jgi:glycosyltransferase involved in cell wall biosynthesis
LTTPAPTVLFVSYPAGLGGSARSLLTLLDGLEGRCRRVVARRPDTTVARLLDTGGLADEVLDLGAGRGPAGRAVDAARLARWARTRRGSLAAVHANGLSEFNVSMSAGRAAGAPVVVWVHDWSTSPANRFVASTARTVGARVEWITVSAANRQTLGTLGVADPARIAVVPNPIALPPEPGGPAGDRSSTALAVGFVGSPARYKGFHLLPDIVAALAATHPDSRWEVWAGPRTLEAPTWAALEARGDPRVRLHDKTADVVAAYRSVDVILCPSLRESFGRVAAEAMAAGTPVVASDLPALREVLGDAGTYFAPGDPDAAAAALAELADHPDRREDVVARGRARARTFAPEAVISEFSRRYGLGPAPTGMRTRRPGTGTTPVAAIGSPPSPGRRVLVVSHEASRSGAPRVAVHVAQALRAHRWRVEVLLRWPGPLADEFAAAADHVRLEPLRRLRAASRPRPRLRAGTLRLDERVAAGVLRVHRPTLVWCNTVLSAAYVRPALDAGIPVVLHVHELGPTVTGVLRRFGLHQHLSEVTVVAASRRAAEQLVETYALEPDAVAVLESAIDVDEVVRSAAGAPTARPDPARPLVAACGLANHSKGVDLWLEMARRVHARRPDARFVWVGRSGPDHGDQARRLGLDGVVTWAGELPSPAATIASAQVFTLPSRHDTFPLALLEAMALGRACVAFDAGGAARQLGDSGVVIPPGDVDAMAGAVLALLNDPARRSRLGAAAHERVRAHFDLAAFASQVGGLATAATSTD